MQKEQFSKLSSSKILVTGGSGFIGFDLCETLIDFGAYLRDFTYIDNGIQMNLLAMTSGNKELANQVYNTAVGDRTTLVQLTQLLKTYLSEYNPKIAEVEVKHGPNKAGVIPHSLASVDKSKEMLGYEPSHKIEDGLKEAVKWYWSNL